MPDRPRITLAWAQSLDGSIAAAPGERTRLSNAASLRMTHALRADHDAILVGIGTVLADDPSLTVRYAPGPSPRPVILDPRLRMPANARLLVGRPAGQGALIFSASTGHDAGWSDRRAGLDALGAELVESPGDGDGLALGAVVKALAERGVRSLMVEGGARVLRAFLVAGLADEVFITIAPRFLAGGLNPFHLVGAGGKVGEGGMLDCELEDVSIEDLEGDILIRGRPVRTE